jgi:tyrosine-protein phosphatase YwqE
MMLSRLFGFKKKENTSSGNLGNRSFAFLKTDIHSHLVPGIDDGAQTVEDSIALIKRIMAMGFTSIVTSPHIKSDHYPNSTETITNGLRELHAALKAEGLDIPVKAAAEYYIDEHFMELLEKRDLLTIYENEVLVELSFMFEPVRFHEVLFKIQTLGYRPILAHPERYAFYHNNFDEYRNLKNKGCLLQLNTIALTGYYGKPVRQIAERLLSEKLYDYCGSDMHHIKHADAMEKVLSMDVYKELTNYKFLNSRL